MDEHLIVGVMPLPLAAVDAVDLDLGGGRWPWLGVVRPILLPTPGPRSPRWLIPNQ
jgi:hypothetical protein